MKKNTLVFWLIIFLSACGSNPTPTPTLVPPSPVPPTLTRTRTATLTPTATLRPTDTPTATPTLAPIKGITTDLLRVRAGPGTDFAILARIDKGASITLLARSLDSKWLLVDSTSNPRGWVSVDFVDAPIPVATLPIADLSPTPTLAPITSTPAPIPPSPTPIALSIPPTLAPIPLAPPLSTLPDDVASELFKRINALRAENGLPAYTWSSQLTVAALRHSRDMAQTGNFDLIGTDNSTVAQRIAEAGYKAITTGENIYGGIATLDDVWSFWSQDGALRDNLLANNFTDAGIGVVENSEMYVFTLDLGQSASATAPPTIVPSPTVTRVASDPCAPISNQTYGVLQLLSGATDPLAERHPDLNLGLRGFAPVNFASALTEAAGAVDPGAPHLRGLFSDQRLPNIARAYAVSGWDWSAQLKGALVRDPEVSMLGLQTTTGETIHTPNAGVDLGEGYAALVLYAASNRITLKYTREDHVVNGYTLHLENVCVEPTLLAAYQKLDTPNRRYLPALRAGQPLGRAAGSEIVIALRDRGNFMDPRSRKDWWQ